MNDPQHVEPSTVPRILAAAIGLAARFFPAGTSQNGTASTRAKHTCFVLDGHLETWSGWSQLSDTDARRFGRLLWHRRSELANAEHVNEQLTSLLGSDALPECSPAADYDTNGTIEVTIGMSLDAYIDQSLDQLDDIRRSRSRMLPPAAPGPHHTTLRTINSDGTVHRTADVHYDIRDHHIPEQVAHPYVKVSPPQPTKVVPLHDLRTIAGTLDSALSPGAGYRQEAVDRFIHQLRSANGASTATLDLQAGELNELIAFTGFGKSVVLIETFACWAALNDLKVGFVLPTNADVVKSSFEIERAIAAVGADAVVAPLTSPRSVFNLAQQSAERATALGADARWIWDTFGYGCAMTAAGTTDQEVDRWQQGHEPCMDLHSPQPGKKRDQLVTCPYRSHCDRYRLLRRACTADIIVTSHANFLHGIVQAPVEDDLGLTDRMTVEELVLRRCQLVIIDEVDTFQRSALDHAGRGLVLDESGRTDTPLRRLDEEFTSAFGRLDDVVDTTVRDAVAVARNLSEQYVSHLAYDRIPVTPPDRRRTPGPWRRWVVPRRWDYWLTARLFGLGKGQPASPDQLDMFRSLYLDEQPPLPNEPSLISDLRPHLRAVATAGRAGEAITTARQRIHALLEGVVVDECEVVVNRLLRRAILERVRLSMHRLMANNADLVNQGISTAQMIADQLGPYGRWKVTPTGPLGRMLLAFTEYHDTTSRTSTKLTAAAFGGDPHVYTVQLGDTTALAHTGTRRIVLGLSATAYFPGAPQHHLHTRPRWWVEDNNPGSVTIKPCPIYDSDRKLVSISGTQGAARRSNTRLLAQLLWERQLDGELQRLGHDDPDRARILLATTSYDAAFHVAEGLSLAGVAGQRITLATQPNRDRGKGSTIDSAAGQPLNTGRWLELAADRLEEFPASTTSDILIAPLARIQRGVNIIGKSNQSALGAIWLIVRPIPVIDEPAELVAHIQSRALADHSVTSPDPTVVLEARRQTAGQFFEEIVGRPPFFRAQPDRVKLGVTAEIMNGAIQLIGRARRGGTSAVLHLADGAFLDPDGGTDFATLIRLLEKQWSNDQVLATMKSIYGTTLDAFLTYAQQMATRTGAAPC